MLAISGVQVGGLVVSLVFCVLCVVYAPRRGRGPLLWGILGFFFSFIAFIILMVLPVKGNALDR